jgi:hypothetical protein
LEDQRDGVASREVGERLRSFFVHWRSIAPAPSRTGPPPRLP